MFDRLRSHRILFSAPILAFALAGCGSSPSEPDRQLQEQIAAVRRATQAFQDFDQARAAGYTARLTPCMSDAAQGGMGFHYGKEAAIDGMVKLEEPEVLLYEPQPDGSLELVGIEYIVPFPQWTAQNPPRLMGHEFHRNETFGLWALHAWLYRENPSGMFADWNPRVSCAAAPPEIP